MTEGTVTKKASSDLPDGWRWTSIGAHYTFKNGLNKAKRFFGQGTPIINYMDVFRHQRLSAAHVQGKVTVSNDEADAYSALKGDAFFTRTSETVLEIGYSAVLLEPIQRAVFSGFVLRGRPKNKDLLPEFAAYALRAREVRKQIESRATYTTRALTNGGSLSECVFPLPKELQQTAIAQALSDIDDLIASFDALIAKKRDIKQGAMQKLLTGKRRLPGFSGEWSKSRLQELCSFITKGATPTTYGFGWQDSGVLFLRSECVSERGLDLAQSNFISEKAAHFLRRGEVVGGDVLITITGNVGRVVILPKSFETAIINQHIARIRVLHDKAFSAFIYHYLSQREVRDYLVSIVTGQAYPQISLKQVRDMEILLPSYDEQTAIANALTDMDSDILLAEGKLRKLNEIRQGMMQQLLTGRVMLK